MSLKNLICVSSNRLASTFIKILLSSGPTLFIASLLKIPIFIQEQNSYPGITNKILSKYADKIIVSYENMEKFIKMYFSFDAFVIINFFYSFYY